MSTQSKATKRQLRNLKVVRDGGGKLWVANTKTLRYHCWAPANNSLHEAVMINEMATREEEGVKQDKVWITNMWEGDHVYKAKQIRL